MTFSQGYSFGRVFYISSRYQANECESQTLVVS